MPKVLVTLSEETLAGLDVLAGKRGRSAWIEAVVRSELETREMAGPEIFDAEVEAVREARKPAKKGVPAVPGLKRGGELAGAPRGAAEALPSGRKIRGYDALTGEPIYK